MTEQTNNEMPSPQKRQRAAANRRLLTDNLVRNLPYKKKQYIVWDGARGRGAGDCVRGLGVLVTPKGSRAYRSTYYFPNSPKAHSRHLGSVNEMSLAEARAQCASDRKLARQGIDPKGSHSTSEGFKESVEHYVKHEVIGKRNNVSHADTQRMLLKECPDWHMRSVATILASEIQVLLDRVRDGDKDKGIKRRPYLANKLHNRLSMFFNWCAKPQTGKVKQSPMLGIDKPWNGEKPRSKEWFSGPPANDAIKALWAAADKIGGNDGKFLKVLMLTGKRKSAIAEMNWRHIDDNWYWDPPRGNDTKRLHSVPLPSLVQEVLGPRKKDGFVFPGNDEGHIYVNGMSLCTKIRKASGIADFIYHGTRHIAETKFAELLIPKHIRNMLLDHVSKEGSGDDYDHHEYRNEKLAAMEKWATYIEMLVYPDRIPSNVIPMRG